MADDALGAEGRLVPRFQRGAPKRICRKLLDHMGGDRTEEIVFVLNGGQKHSVLGFERAARTAPQRLRMIYSDIRPAQLGVLEL